MELARVLSYVGSVFIGLLLTAIILIAFQFGGLIVLLGLLCFYGWVFFAFLHYRHCRREELLEVLASAASSNAPLAPALRAYLMDRPRGRLRQFFIATLLFIIPGYYCLWYRRSNFDRRVAELVFYLEQGVPLHQALRNVPGIASTDAILAAAVGDMTDQLGQCLRITANRRRFSTLWLEQFPRLAYPLVILLVIGSVVGFLSYFIVPKFQRIFQDFDSELPEYTARLIGWTDRLAQHSVIVILAVQVIALLTILVALNSTVRWFLPGMSVVYRGTARSRVLGMLSLLLGTGKTVPQSLQVLGSLPLGRAVTRRIETARFRVQQGERLAESLLDAGLMPRSFLPLVNSAERAGNLPWALGELSDSLYKRALRVVDRVTQALFPVSIVLLGGLVAYVIVAFFVPLIQLIGDLAG